MAGLEVGALVALTAKLIGVGIDAVKAREDAGWGTEDAKALQSALATVPDIRKLFNADDGSSGPFQAYIELVAIAFGEAWRRHWVYDERLAPKASQRTWKTWLKSKAVKERIAQVEARLRDARLGEVFRAAIPGEGDAFQDLELLEAVKNPLSSPWYAALWQAFTHNPEDAQSPPLLVVAGDGTSQREFERHFRLAFREGLTTPFGKPILDWQQGHGEERSALIRELLAARLSAMRTEHLFGTGGKCSGLPHLLLETQYVEPDAQLVSSEQRHGAEPVLGLIETLLQQPNTHIIVVVADFGRGKSLTARTLAYRYAERYLEASATPTPARDYPIFVRCQESLTKRSLDAETAVRRGQKRIAEAFLSRADVNDEAFGLPPLQKTLVIMDGLDEVQLSGPETVDLFDDLLSRAHQERRFIVLSRPAAVPREVRWLDHVVVVELQDFRVLAEPGRKSHVQAWLDAWADAFHGPIPSLGELKHGALLELCAVPVLLFMVAQTWERVRDLDHITEKDLYNEFIMLTARSKLVHDAPSHPVVERAANHLLEVFVQSGLLPKEASRELAIIELLSRIAWKGHVLDQLSEPKALTTHDLKNLVRDLDLSGSTLELVERGVLLAMSVSLSDGEPELDFAHKSFREFLVAKYWEARLARIVDARPKDQKKLETQLYGASLIVDADNSYRFLVALCRFWPRQKRERLVEWASDAANDETISADTLRDDERYTLREAALGIATALSEQPIKIEHRLTLASLIAPFQVRGVSVKLRGTGILSANAMLPWAPLAFAHLECATLDRANFHGANLAHANLAGADLTGANLVRANLEGANLTGANLEGANLTSANLIGASLDNASFERASLGGASLNTANIAGANLAGADLKGTNLAGANLVRAHLVGAGLVGANLVRANLSGANLQGANLDRANLAGANLVRVTLDRANLEDSSLVGANLAHATLCGSNLAGANLEDADLTGADVVGANFVEANLAGAALAGVELASARLESAAYTYKTKFPTDFDPAHCSMLRVEQAGVARRPENRRWRQQRG